MNDRVLSAEEQTFLVAKLQVFKSFLFNGPQLRLTRGQIHEAATITASDSDTDGDVDLSPYMLPNRAEPEIMSSPDCTFSPIRVLCKIPNICLMEAQMTFALVRNYFY